MDFFDKLDGGYAARAPRPTARYGLAEGVAEQLEALALAPDRPLVAVDADEVLLAFAAHFAEWLETRGFRLTLTEYRLDGAMTRLSDGTTVSKEDGWRLIDDFFRQEAVRQRLVGGAVDALAALAERAQVVILTNVPRHARASRVENLRAQGVDFPLIANSGGKGRPLRWIWDRLEQPMAFIDDSAVQLGSAAKRAPEVYRVHYVADPEIRRLAGRPEAAQCWPESWAEAAAEIRAAIEA